MVEWIIGKNDFPARWVCGNWSKIHGWIHICSDFLVWAAYMVIPIVLVYFILKKKDFPFPKILFLFGAFIFSCGTVHLLEAFIYWTPIYRISAGFKVITAIVSWATVFALIPIVPFALNLKTPAALQKEVELRRNSEANLKARTKELEDIKENLEKKVSERAHQIQAERDLLENKVVQRTQELNKRVAELEQINKSLVGRELRMVELKKEIENLKNQLKKYG